jgi:anti-sigma factor ChrR (cupin superfamily)
MTRHCLAVVVLVALTCSLARLARTADRGDAAAHSAAGAHHILVLPDDVEWRDAPPSLPSGAKVAILEGDPAKPGFFAMRAKMPDGYRVPPHWHPGVERVTVLSGTFHLGGGEKFDKAAGRAMPAGTYSSMPPGMKHFGWAEGETIIQIATEGPWGITYVDPNDDPRNRK